MHHGFQNPDKVYYETGLFATKWVSVTLQGLINKTKSSQLCCLPKKWVSGHILPGFNLIRK